MDLEAINERLNQLETNLQAKREAAIAAMHQDAQDLDAWPDRQAAIEEKRRLAAKANGTIAKAVKDTEAKANELRDQAAEIAETRRREIAQTYFEDMRKGEPIGSDGWQAAGVREKFIRQDLQDLNPGEVVLYYLHTQDSKDRVGTYLAGRLGREILRDRVDSADPGQADPKAIQALDDLESLTIGPAREKRDAARSEVDRLLTEITMPRFEVEKARMQKSYGVKVPDRGVKVGPDGRFVTE
jgi:hypothetical protein